MTPVNVFLTQTQRDHLVDEYLNKLATMGYDDLVDETYAELLHMKNPEFYSECLEFMPDCMNKLRALEIR